MKIDCMVIKNNENKVYTLQDLSGVFFSFNAIVYKNSPIENQISSVLDMGRQYRLNFKI